MVSELVGSKLEVSTVLLCSWSRVAANGARAIVEVDDILGCIATLPYDVFGAQVLPSGADLCI